MTGKQRDALEMLRQARETSPTTSDGVTTSAATFYDREVDVAYVHWATASALKAEGLVEFVDWDPEWGTELRLTEKGLAA